MMIALLFLALTQLTPRQEAEQKANESALDQWVRDHQVELRQKFERMKRVQALTYDQAIIVYDQCLARAAASLHDVPPESVFNRALALCLPMRAELLNGRPPQWFFGFKSLDDAKRASFPALTRILREQLRAHNVASDGTSADR